MASQRTGHSGFVLALSLLVLLLAGCASSGDRLTEAGSETVARTREEAPGSGPSVKQASSGAARPVRQRAGEAVPRATSPNVRGIAVPVHVIERRPRIVEAASSQEAPARPLKVDVPGPAGPPKPGSRGVGYPATGASVFAATTSPAGPLAPAVEGGFDSTTYDDNAINAGTFFVPADPVATAGPTSLVNAVNVTIRFHGKDGSLAPADEMPLAGEGATTGFFDSLLPDSELFDPKVLYDEHAERFVVIALDYCDDLDPNAAECAVGPTGSRILVAVSDDSTPQGTWYQAAISTKLSISASDHWVDFPGLAVDEEAIYVNGNMFDFSSGAFGGVRLWIIDKFGGAGGGFYGGGTATVNGPYDPYTCQNCVSTTTQPAHVFGNQTDPGVGTFLVSYSGLSADCLVAPPSGCPACAGGGDFDGPESVQLVRIDDPLGTPSFAQELVQVTNLENRSDCSPLPTAPQSGAVDVETNDRSVLNAVWQDGFLYFAATIDPRTGPDSGEATAHWWQLDVSNLGDTSVADQGDVSGDVDIATNAATFFPSIAVNTVGEMALGFSASAATINPGSYYTTRKPADTPSSTSGEETLRVGLDGYERYLGGADNRWGDYSSVAVDPATQCFWVYNKHSLCIDGSGGDVAPCPAVPGGAADNGRWGTAYGRVCIDCETSPLMINDLSTDQKRRASQIEVQGTADVPGTVDVTLEGQVVSFENGFSVASGGELAVFTGFCPLP